VRPATYEHAGRRRLGAVADGAISELPFEGSMADLIASAPSITSSATRSRTTSPPAIARRYPQPDGSFVYRFGPGKNFDTAAPLGPWIVTADEIPDPQALAAYVGGSPTNISVGGRRLGLRTALLTGIGDDPVGDFVLRLLGENGVIEESSGFYVGRELKIPER
jgi:Fumarylacetoacetate (FAA) hydrolase family/pfkB family carbohydrate kinase